MNRCWLVIIGGLSNCDSDWSSDVYLLWFDWLLLLVIKAVNLEDLQRGNFKKFGWIGHFGTFKLKKIGEFGCQMGGFEGFEHFGAVEFWNIWKIWLRMWLTRVVGLKFGHQFGYFGKKLTGKFGGCFTTLVNLTGWTVKTRTNWKKWISKFLNTSTASIIAFLITNWLI